MTILFAKYHGAGNDFIVIDDREETFPATNTRLIERMCDRHYGIGADGLLLMQRSSAVSHTLVSSGPPDLSRGPLGSKLGGNSTMHADMRMRIFNSNGQEAEMCGNGLRCLVDFAYQLHCIGTHSTIETAHGIIVCEWDSKEITINLGSYTWMYEEIQLDNLQAHMIHTGVPHAVIFGDQFSLAPMLRHHPALGPKGANVNFAIVREGKIYNRTFERGVERETLACGSGAAAVAIAAQAKYHLSNPITVVPSSGEELRVEVHPLFVKLSGKATFVFHGSFNCAN